MNIRKHLPHDITARELIWVALALLLLLALAGWGLFRLAPPGPPAKVVMTTGAADGAYHAYAMRYRDVLAEYDVELVLRPSTGSAQNLQRLLQGEDGVQVGLVQSGLATAENAPGLVSLGSMFYEPVWVFYRGTPIDRLADLRGKRIAVGTVGSGTHALAMALTRENGLVQAPTTLVELGGMAAADALIDGAVDAALFVSGIEGPAIGKLLSAPDVALMNMRLADAYERRLPYLDKLVLPEGVIDLQNNIPRQPTTLVALTAELMAHRDLHPVVTELLLIAAQRVHGGRTALNPANTFPSPKNTELPLSRDADRFYKEGSSFLRRVLPFWVAIWVERLMFVVLPLIVIAVPLFTYFPKLYDWHVIRKLNRWYVELHRIEEAIGSDAEKRGQQLTHLDEIDARLNKLKVPTAYLANLYTLRTHADYVRSLVAGRAVSAASDAGPNPAPSAAGEPRAE